MSPESWRRLPGAIVLLALAACGVPRESAPIRYFLLEAPPPAVVTPMASVRIALGPVSVAEYLDQPRLVVRGAAPALELRDDARWAMPLARNLGAVLRAALAAALPGIETRDYAAPDTLPFACRVVVEVSRLDGTPGGRATLDAGWHLLDPAGQPLAAHGGHVTLHADAGDSLAALVTSESELVAELAAAIAADLARVPALGAP